MTDAVTRLNAALVGRYRIDRRLGEGGMATVYLADDLRHERKVALKVLKPELAAVVGADRFLAEIKTTANLQHPHILPLFDSGEADSFLFYVMPYVEGESLRDRLDREHQLPVDEAVQIAKNVAEALDYAHSRGVIHRDIKPANILLQAGKPVVSDFGIALAVGAAGGGRLTETGLSLGTPHYMSPEQATGDLSVGAASDTYALGCVLYEMLVGSPPFVGSTPQAVLGKIVTGEAPSARADRKSVPSNVDAAIRKALEKVPADRFRHCRDLAHALDESTFTHDGSVARRAGAGGGPWRAWAVVSTVAVAALAVTLVVVLDRPRPSPRVTRQVLSSEWIDLSRPLGRSSAIAPDGSSMILPVVSPETGARLLGLKLSESTEITALTGTEGAQDVVYSPDGQSILYGVGADIIQRMLATGASVRLTEGATGQVAAFDWLGNQEILYEESTGEQDRPWRVSLMSPDAVEPQVVFWPEGAFNTLWIRSLPGARAALVVGCPGYSCPGGARARLHLVDVENRSSQRYMEGVLRAWYAPTGHLVYVDTEGAVFAQPFDSEALEATGPPVRLFEGVHITSTPDVGVPDITLGADGTLIYVESDAGPIAGDLGDDQLVVVDLAGREEVLPLSSRPIGWVGWSPDGRSVAYDSRGQLYTYNVSLGTTPREIASDGVFAYFSPDGSRLVYGGPEMFVVDTLGDSSGRPVIELEGTEWPSQWANDTLILFEWIQETNSDLAVLNLSDPERPRAEIYLPSEAALADMVLSPDGRFVAYRATESGVSRIYVRSFPDPAQGERLTVSGDGGRVPFWSPDGDVLYYWRRDGGGLGTFLAAHIQRDPRLAVVSTDSLFTGPWLQPLSGSGLHPDGDRWILVKPVIASPGSTPDVASPGRLVYVQSFFEELERLVPN